MEQRLAGVHFPISDFVDGRLSGIHRSAQPGVSVEFAEHKEYSPGDDLRHLNWKAYARLDRFYIRQFTRETHAEVVLVLDTSGSMNYQSKLSPHTKLFFAAQLAAAMSYVFLHQNDAVGILTLNGSKMGRFVPPRSHPSHLMTIQEVLLDVLNDRTVPRKAEGQTEFMESLDYLISRKTIRSGVILLSDLFTSIPSLFPYLAYLKAQGNFVWLVHTLDPAEYDFQKGSDRSFPFDGSMRFRSSETGRSVLMDCRLNRRDYLRRMEEFLGETQHSAAEARVIYNGMNSDEEPVECLLKALLERR